MRVSLSVTVSQSVKLSRHDSNILAEWSLNSTMMVFMNICISPYQNSGPEKLSAILNDQTKISA